MAVLDDDFPVDGTLAEGGGIWSPPKPPPADRPHDYRSLYEQERARADAAETRCEELRSAELAARTDAGLWKSRFKSCRRRLSEAEEETKELRRTAKDALSSQAEAARLKQLLADAGVGTGKGAAVAAQHKTAQEPQARRDTPRSRSREARQLRKALETTQAQKDRIQALRHENSDLRKAVKEAQTQKGTIRALSGMNECLRERLGDFRDQRDRIRVLSWQVDTHRLDLDCLRRSLKKSEDEKKSLSQALADAQADHRKALRRSRRQKSAIKSLAGENARLRKAVRRTRRRIEALETQLAKLRASRATMSKRLYGRKSEQKKKPRSERKRGQQRGASGHGRTQRPGLDERTEELEVPEEARVCGCCGQPYAPNGAEVSTLVEIEVIVYKRVISRERLRRTCACASSPAEVTAPPAPRLFVRTPYGTTFWARFLFEHCACFRPLRRVAAWFSSQGLAVSPGTLANSRKRFVALFGTLYEAILAHQNTAMGRQSG